MYSVLVSFFFPTSNHNLKKNLEIDSVDLPSDFLMLSAACADRLPADLHSFVCLTVHVMLFFVGFILGKGVGR